MKSMRRGLAALLAVLLMMPTLPATAEELVENGTVMSVSGNESVSDNETASDNEVSVETVVDKVLFNTGNYAFSVVDAASYENGAGDACFAEDGSYTINIPEANPFFPYEVQFTHEGNVFSQWFMTPDDSVEVGGHTFYVSAYFDNTAMTQLSLNVAGDTVVVYPEAKEFTNDGGIQLLSLLPLEEKSLTVDLTGYTPIELTQVSVDTLFAGEELVADTDKIIWRYYDYYGEEEYTISETGDKINLSYDTYYNSYNNWEMIVGEADQLAADNIRYMVRVNQTASRDWLVPQVYVQGEDGTRNNVTVTSASYYDYDTSKYFYIYVAEKDLGTSANAYVSFALNTESYPTVNYDHMKAYAGQFNTVEEAMAGTDITEQIFASDMSKTNAGYLVNTYNTNYMTLVTFDANNNVVGWMSFYFYCYPEGNYMYPHLSGTSYYTYSTSTIDGCQNRTYTLYAGTPANGEYYIDIDYSVAGYYKNDAITAAYLGNYTTIADAVAANATDVLADLIGSGYKADYSQGVYFSIFVGEDGTDGQEVYRYCIKTVEGTQTPSSSSSGSLYSGTSITFSGLKDADGYYVGSYETSTDMDSYAENNYLTILVGKDVDLTNLAPVFSQAYKATVYTAGSSTPEVSGQSFHDFSQGPVQYTVSAEDGINAKNYWLQIVNATEGTGKLYMNSLVDPEANTKEENGVIYTTRSVMLDNLHSNTHNIFLANIGTEAIPALDVELVSDVVELDAYWTLKGNHELSGFTTVNESSNYGELPNLAKLTLKAKDTVENGTEVTGTMTLKSGDTVLMVITLTGTVGNPSITTKEIPEAVKYVPYGTMIQNSNKYSWNTVSYELWRGTLPEGMIIKPNGELYGVPTETGTFDFAVRMNNSYSDFGSDTRWYTLIINENTDENVDGATDEGYVLSERVEDVDISASEESYTMVSEGEYAEFVALYLDGVMLTEGEDYDSESGSTRITIKSQTLLEAGADSVGTHTLGIEFRTQDTDTLKRAAQNFDVVDTSVPTPAPVTPAPVTPAPSTPAPSTPAPSTPAPATPVPSTPDSGNNAGNSSGTGTVSAVTGVAGAATTTTGTVSYTVVSGDSLWKIAKKFYGDGNQWQKIFEDNADILTSADKIYVGQVLTIYAADTTAENTQAATGSDRIQLTGDTYVVEAGDSLWKIAKKLYGKGSDWEKLYQANKDVIANPENIYKGQVLVIPEA